MAKRLESCGKTASMSVYASKREVTLGLMAIPAAAAASKSLASQHISKGNEMEKVQGIGGFFFRSKDPEGLRTWYRDHLGIDMAPQFSGGAPWMQDAGFTVFDPFPTSDTMIPEGKSWMINFRVGNLGKMAEQLRSAKIEVSAIEEYPHGKFATLSDPEGNGIQLWEVAAP